MKEVGARHQVRGLLYEFGIHHLDVMQTLGGSSVQEILATVSEDESTVVVTARLTGGTMVSSTFSEGESYNDEVEIYAEAGRLRVSCYRFDGFEFFPTKTYPGERKIRMQLAMDTLKELPHGLSQLGQGGDFIDSYRMGWHYSMDAIRRNGKTDCTLEEAMGALQLVLAAKESAELGKPVKVSPPVQNCS